MNSLQLNDLKDNISEDFSTINRFLDLRDFFLVLYVLTQKHIGNTGHLVLKKKEKEEERRKERTRELDNSLELSFSIWGVLSAHCAEGSTDGLTMDVEVSILPIWLY